MQNILKKMKISLILPIPQYILSKYVYLDNIYLVEKKGMGKNYEIFIFINFLACIFYYYGNLTSKVTSKWKIY